MSPAEHPAPRHARFLAVGLLALLLTACFEEPIREELELRFQSTSYADKVEVALGVSFRVDDEKVDSYPLRNRIEGDRYQLLTGADDWGPRFDRLDAASHEIVYERDHGVLTGVEHKAEVDLTRDPDALRRFFSNTLINAFFEARGERVELSLLPLAPGRATRRQRQRLEQAFDPWTESLAGYFRATGELYSYLDRHPDRAEVCFSVLFEDVLPEGDGGKRPLLLSEEEELVDAVDQAMTEAWDILVIDPQEAYSINEISRLAYDPFPALVRVVPPGPVVEMEGFVEDDEEGLRVPAVSFWEALRGLEGRWVSPNLLVLYVEQSGGVAGEPRGPRFDLKALLALERSHAPPPSAAEIRAAIEQRLAPAPLYRVVWEREPPEER